MKMEFNYAASVKNTEEYGEHVNMFDGHLYTGNCGSDTYEKHCAYESAPWRFI